MFPYIGAVSISWTCVHRVDGFEIVRDHYRSPTITTLSSTSDQSSTTIAVTATTPIDNDDEFFRLNRSASTDRHRRRRRCLSAYIDVDYLSNVQHQHLSSYVVRWNFDCFQFDRLAGGHPVRHLGLHIFHQHHLIHVFQLDWTKLLHCLDLIEIGYFTTNPFHNAVHATDVAQAMHCLLNESFLQENGRMELTNLEKLACLLAAFGHDLYHPGVSQYFLERTNHFLCSLYNNISVLENFHWRCLFSVLNESRLLEQLPLQQWHSLNGIIEQVILATDMQRQHDYLRQFKAFLRFPRQLVDSRSRITLMQILIKCADISNPCRPWPISKAWSDCACREFFMQGDRERELGLPVVAFCDRFSTNVAQMQSGFMEYIAMPLFVDWDRFVQSRLSKYMLHNLIGNRTNWLRVLDDQQRAARRPSTTIIATRRRHSAPVLVAYHPYQQSYTQSSTQQQQHSLARRRGSLPVQRLSSNLCQLIEVTGGGAKSSSISQRRRHSEPVLPMLLIDERGHSSSGDDARRGSLPGRRWPNLCQLLEAASS